ncbi:serine/threonine protein kinase [Anabaena lutea]|uniref:non-specific serine/threonine protein kinase n=1 Tax=Anabaena lutea FACHB-196 TaxID=2692881 RepID=A0ABR8FE86_9NOST|nr:serine/threonine-protein kinase [Anabaena lutea]MBD2568542.1 serine/threonine protein kinase [Anabaena lutea FACHB-196]
MEMLHQPGEIIAERYCIIGTLGQGGIGITYQAEDIQKHQQVALKALALRRMTEWKVLELFEREAKILAQLNHPRIPQYIDYFQIDTESDRAFYIAQQLAPGKSLAVLVDNSWKPDESEVKRLAIQVLEILVYLHSLTPSVIHRDIKPQNILRDEKGQIFLVDFGAVQDTYQNTVTGGSTVVGTYGYMAPEQFRGQAVLSTDLYGLGTTILFLLMQKSPADLPQRKLKIDFRSHVRISQDFADWLEKMIEPVIEDRFPGCNEALAVLRGEQAITNYFSQKHRRPKNTIISLTETDQNLVIEIPPIWLTTPHSRLFALIPIIWNGFFLLLLWIIAASNLSLSFSGILFLIVFGSIGISIIGIFLFSAAFRTRIEINQQHFQLKRWFLSICYQQVQANTLDITEIKLNPIGLKMNKQPITVCLLRIKLFKHRFGTFLMQSEKEWLMGEISHFISHSAG